MTRRRLPLALGTALAVLVTMFLWLALWEPGGPGITAANCARIKEGMPRKEGEALLGGPPTRPSAGDEQVWWDGDKGVSVWFDRDGRAYATLYGERSRLPRWCQWCLDRLLP